MAVARTNPKCFKCGGTIYGRYADRGDSFVGDTFIGWDYDSHECPPEVKTLKQFKAHRDIKTVEDYSYWASEIFEKFLSTFTEANGLIRKPNEHFDYFPEEFDFIYTDRGMKLAERMRNRLMRIGHAHFDDGDVEVESHLFKEY